MRLDPSDPAAPQLTYCLNIHPGESWSDARKNVERHALPVRAATAPDRPFGMGLRLSRRAADEWRALPDTTRRDQVAAWRRDGLYVFTLNGFPYGAFHGRPVKENVYAPDWNRDERRDYTLALAEALADFLPADEPLGTISTVPLGFRPRMSQPRDIRSACVRLAHIVRQLRRLEQERGARIVLALEPEPGCVLETTDLTIACWNERLLPGVRRELLDAGGWTGSEAEAAARAHLGLCLDTCHFAVLGEDPAAALRAFRAAGIAVPKIQLSAALRLAGGPDAAERLRAFEEPVYLHQTTAWKDGRRVGYWHDLPAACASGIAADEWRVHFHVPLDWAGDIALGSTAAGLTPDFWRAARETPHVEVETYTFDVLPPSLRAGGVDESVIRELRWAREKLERARA